MHLRNLLRSARLNVQKLDTMLLNDIKLFLRDRKSLVIVLLTPFIILSILINIYAFSDVADNIRGVGLAICDRDGRGFDLNSQIFETTMFTGNCETEVAEKVTSGEFRGAIVIPEKFRQDLIDGRGTELSLFIDNSKQTTAVVTTNAVKAYVSDLNEEIGTAFIREAWKQLKELNDNLRFLVVNLEKAKPVAVQMRKELKEIKTELDSIDFDSQKASVEEVVGFLNTLEIELDYVDESINGIEAEIPMLLPVNYTANITDYKRESEWYRTMYCGNASLDPVCPLLNFTDKYIESLSTELVSGRNELNSKIIELNDRSAQVQESIDRLVNVVASSSAKGSELRKGIESVRSNIIYLEDKTDNITESIEQLDNSLNTFLDDLIRITDELNNTIEVLDTYVQKDPATILRPVHVEVMPVFKEKLQIFYNLPALISILLLFITLFVSSSQIVNERKGGTMARIFLSPISMFFYLFEKMIYLLLLSLMTIAAMILATYVFGVGMAIGIELIIVLMISALVYISLGVLIGSVSRSENTSLLTCLVLGFPLMFLSGAFSPPELMDQLVRIGSEYLPLTLNINLIENITIYHTGLDTTKLAIMAGMLVVFYLLAAVMIRKKPTLK
ncbi:ABC transporter permease [Candidatus Woesearchaeota archaeon]|nr:ABC transporter permease [Candidatus Woesearchaeota archaeon]